MISLRLYLVSILALHTSVLIDRRLKPGTIPTPRLYMMLSIAEVHLVLKTLQNRSGHSEGSDHCSGRVYKLDLTLGRLDSSRAGTHG